MTGHHSLVVPPALDAYVGTTWRHIRLGHIVIVLMVIPPWSNWQFAVRSARGRTHRLRLDTLKQKFERIEG